MPFRSRSFIVALVALSLMVTVVPVDASLADIQRRLEQNQRILEDLNRNFQSAQQNLDQTEREIEALEAYLAQIERELRATEAELARVTEELRQAEQRVDDAREHLRQTEEELAYRTELMRRRVRAMHEQGPVRYLEVLLTARSFYEFISRLEMMRVIVRADVDLFHRVSELREEAEDYRNAMEIEMDLTARLRDEVASQRARLDAQVAAQQSTLSAKESLVQRLERDLLQMEQDSQRVTDMIRADQATIEAYRRQGELAFVWPLRPRGWVSSPFGMRYHPILRTSSFHTGIDIAAPTGTSILASEEGRVSYAGWLGGYGLTIIIDHGGQVSTLYAHASQLLVSSGQIVTRGQLIARVGTTGLSTGPHLHFEIRVNGEPVNPAPRLP